MKRFALLLALLLTVLCVSGCAANPAPAAASDPAAPGTTPPTEAPVITGELLPDFTVETIDGGTFTLSEALKTHELVLINLWATWCPPCKMEFPFLQEAWSQNADRVAVIALSIEAEDTVAVLQDFAKENGLTFPIGREEGTNLSRFVTTGIPTTILVDRYGQVKAVEIGAKTSTQEFLELFDGLTGEDYDASVCTYTVIAYGELTGDEVEGVTVNFCTDTTCTPVTTSALGRAVFTGPPAQYHGQIVSVPEGWELAGDAEFYTEAYGGTFWIPFRAVDQ